MKIWLDENYNIVKIEGGSHFTKGNHNFDILQVYVLTANIARDNTLPTFNFELANGSRYGPFTHNSGTVFEDSYTVFSYRLRKNCFLWKAGYLLRFPLTILILIIRFINRRM